MKQLIALLLSITLWAHTAPHHTPPLPPKNTWVAITYVHSMVEDEKIYHTIRGEFLGKSKDEPGKAIILYRLGEREFSADIPIKNIEVITPRLEIEKILKAWLNLEGFDTIKA